MEVLVDSLKVTGASLGSMGIQLMEFLDIVPWILAVAVGVLQIIYLIKKISRG